MKESEKSNRRVSFKKDTSLLDRISLMRCWVGGGREGVGGGGK